MYCLLVEHNPTGRSLGLRLCTPIVVDLSLAEVVYFHMPLHIQTKANAARLCNTSNHLVLETLQEGTSNHDKVSKGHGAVLLSPCRYQSQGTSDQPQDSIYTLSQANLRSHPK